MRLKGSFGNMTAPTIIDDLFSSSELKCFITESNGVEYDVSLVLHCKNEIVGQLK
jgi:hypothetical protein